MRRRAVAGGAVAVALVITATALGGAFRTTGESVPGASAPGSAVPGSTAPSASGSPAEVARPKRAGQGADHRWLLPDMRSLPARDLQIRGTADRRRLVFSALLANDGPGPVVLRPRGRRQCPRGQRSADQVLHYDRAADGVFQRRADRRRRTRDAGCMLDHPTHDHWHFDAMASYALLSRDGFRPVVSRDKVSFCLRDNAPVPGRAPRQRREYFGECEADLVQGISPGWVDIYDTETPGQSLRLPPNLPDGIYCLVLRADPHDQLVETDEDDNAAARAVRLRGADVGRPGGRSCRGAVG